MKKKRNLELKMMMQIYSIDFIYNQYYNIKPLVGVVMERFNKTIYGYDPVEVKAYLDEIISLVEKMVASNKEKNKEIIRLSKELEETKAKYEELKENFNKIIDNK